MEVLCPSTQPAFVQALAMKELEKDGMVIRKEYLQVPPKIEYSLSKKGQRFIPILNELCLFWEEVMNLHADS